MPIRGVRFWAKARDIAVGGWGVSGVGIEGRWVGGWGV